MDIATLRNITAFAPVLADPAFVAGEWTKPERSAEGVITMAWLRLSDPASASAFVAVIATEDVAAPYHRPVTDAARATLLRLTQDPSAITDATADQIGWVLTYLLRADRFVEGSLGHAFDTGLMLAIARRAAVLTQ
ncbi:DUF6508 domain-containing protein [Sphingomonas sp. PB1R3]|uniref:DUF6508 domain-containing protein n=1 Tax=Sphingomonas flavida TaxID=3096154 RepID=UPI002FCC6955